MATAKEVVANVQDQREEVKKYQAITGGVRGLLIAIGIAEGVIGFLVFSLINESSEKFPRWPAITSAIIFAVSLVLVLWINRQISKRKTATIAMLEDVEAKFTTLLENASTGSVDMIHDFAFRLVSQWIKHGSPQLYGTSPSSRKLYRPLAELALGCALRFMHQPTRWVISPDGVPTIQFDVGKVREQGPYRVICHLCSTGTMRIGIEFLPEGGGSPEGKFSTLVPSRS